MDVSAVIQKLFEDEIKPAVAMDGGEIRFVDYNPTTNQVFVSLHGACETCGIADMTLKQGIERMLREKVDPAIEVVPIED